MDNINHNWRPGPDDNIARPIVSLHPQLKAEQVWHAAEIKIIVPWPLKDMLSWEDGPWQESLLTQPPCKEIELTIRDSAVKLGYAGEEIHFKVTDEKGLRLCKVVDELRTKVRSQDPNTGEKSAGDPPTKTDACSSLDESGLVTGRVFSAVLPNSHHVHNAQCFGEWGERRDLGKGQATGGSVTEEGGHANPDEVQIDDDSLSPERASKRKASDVED